MAVVKVANKRWLNASRVGQWVDQRLDKIGR